MLLRRCCWSTVAWLFFGLALLETSAAADRLLPPRPSRAQTAVGQIFHKAGVTPRDVVVKDPKFYRRLLSDPRFELGETYMDGLWESPAIDQVTTKLLSSWQTHGLATGAPYWRTPGLAARSVPVQGWGGKSLVR